MSKKKSGQHFLLDLKNVDIDLVQVGEMSEYECFRMISQLRWGDADRPACPVLYCGLIDKHYLRKNKKQFRCKGCHSYFSPTSGTIFHQHKISLKKLLMALLIYVTSENGTSALQVSRQIKITYKSALALLGKVRELHVYYQNTNIMYGNIELDGAQFCGVPRRPARKKKLTKAQEEKMAIAAAKKGKVNKRVYQTNFSNFDRLKSRRTVMNFRLTVPEVGGIQTVVAVCNTENEADTLKILNFLADQNATIQTDEAPAFKRLGTVYGYDHRTVNHSIEFVSIMGNNENQAESYFARLRRFVKGLGHRMSTTYLLDYAAEMAWREDFRRVTPMGKLENIFRKTNNHGISRWWLGYWQGQKRGRELTVDELLGILHSVRIQRP